MEPNAPCLSVGFPVFNGEKYLEQALNSIIAQTFTDFELIVSDNASTDKTQAICMQFAAKDPRIRYYRNDHNVGAAPNFNSVVKLARGKYFKWAAYDDLNEPDFFMKCLEVLEHHPDIILCYPRAKLVDAQGAFREDYDPMPNVCSLDRPAERFREFILYPHLAVQIFGIYRTDVLNNTKLHRSFPSSDEVLLAELALLGKFYEVQDRLFLNRVHEEQSTKGKLVAQRSRIAWVDASLEGKIVLAHWMYFFGCLQVIQNAPVSIRDKVSCYWVMVRWLLRADHLRAMGKDVLLAAGKMIRSSGKQVKAQFIRVNKANILEGTMKGDE